MGCGAMWDCFCVLRFAFGVLRATSDPYRLLYGEDLIARFTEGDKDHMSQRISHFTYPTAAPHGPTPYENRQRH